MMLMLLVNDDKAATHDNDAHAGGNVDGAKYAGQNIAPMSTTWYLRQHAMIFNRIYYIYAKVWQNNVP